MCLCSVAGSKGDSAIVILLPSNCSSDWDATQFSSPRTWRTLPSSGRKSLKSLLNAVLGSQLSLGTQDSKLASRKDRISSRALFWRANNRLRRTTGPLKQKDFGKMPDQFPLSAPLMTVHTSTLHPGKALQDTMNLVQGKEKLQISHKPEV